eukprot:1867623-Rhodomonas_salina.2
MAGASAIEQHPKLLHVLVQILASQSMGIGLVLAVHHEIHHLQPVRHILRQALRPDLQRLECLVHCARHVRPAMVPRQQCPPVRALVLIEPRLE